MIARHRRVPGLVLLFASAAVVAFAGCAKQSEGQRCVSAANGNNDCNSPLICVPAAQLQDKSTDRCCPKAGLPIHVASCTRGGGIGGGDGGIDSGTGGTDSGTDAGDAAGGTSGSGGSGAGGASGSGGTSGASAGGATDASAG